MRCLRRQLLRSALALAVTGLAACTDAPPTGLQVQLYTAPEAADPFEGVSFIRLVMEGEGLAGAYSQLLRYVEGTTANLDGVPFSVAGQSRRLTVEGWAAGATGEPSALVSRGRALPVAILEGQPAEELSVLFARVNHFQELVNVDALSAQYLSGGRLGQTVTKTDTAQGGEIVVAGGATVSDIGAWWKPEGFDGLVASVEAIDRVGYTAAVRTKANGTDYMVEGRAFHTAVPLASGEIILAGGYVSSGQPTSSVELYLPEGVLDGTSKLLPPMGVARAGHTATLIDETTPTILFVGGDEAGTWELWDPVYGSQGEKPLPDSLPRRFHTATEFFIAGRTEPAVLIAGGESDLEVHATAMLYDSVAKAWVAVSEALPSGGRTAMTATLVDGHGFVYLVGGFTDVARSVVSSAIDVFDIGSLSFNADARSFQMRTGRGGHSAALLPNNTVVIAGGVGFEGDVTMKPLSSIEVIHEYLDATAGVLRIEVASSFNPEATAAVVPYMPVDRVGLTALSLDNGMALLVGGAARDPATGALSMVPNLTLYNPL